MAPSQGPFFMGHGKPLSDPTTNSVRVWHGQPDIMIELCIVLPTMVVVGVLLNAK